MGAALTFVLTLASFVCGVLYHLVLVPFHLEYLKTIVFIAIVAALVQFVEMFLKKYMTSLYEALGIYLPLITTNCAVLGVALLNVQKDYSILVGTIYGLATAVGYWIAIVVLAFLREKITGNDIPRPFQGFPIVMVTAALMSIAFFGFAGIKF
jgi:electron transport complex protein RnfA